ncbi:MAG: iron ABC transporter permease [Dehalococcoidia bacterium]|nr:iron ABC transporter permease [Dehalococcoidia bacterium]
MSGKSPSIEVAQRAGLPRLPFTRSAGLVVCAVALLGACVLSLRVGSIGISNADAFDALFAYDAESYNQTVVRTLRLPRTLIALGVGAGLAVAGGVMQAATRNPLAAPQILGVNTGAAFAIVTAIFFIGLSDPAQYVWFAFAGALAAAALVYGIASAGRGGATPVKLALAGAVITALLSSWITAILLLDQQTLDIVRFWLAGSVAGRSLDIFWMVSPLLALGVAGGLLISHQLNVLSLGDDMARALGMHTTRIRGIAAVLVVLMTGAAVAAAGPIGFVGLAVPHIVRTFTGPDYRWILPYCVLCGPLLLLLADVAGRVIVRPAELQVGIVTALVGAPFLVAIARSRRIASL